MNKIEYLNILKEALKDTDQSTMEEIISDYEEHFQAGIENGKTEEQICEDLGSIEDLAEEIKDVYSKARTSEKSGASQEQGSSENEKSKEWHFSFKNIDSEKIDHVINSALNSAEEMINSIDVKEIGNTVKNTFGQAASSLNNFADSYLKPDSGKWKGEGHQENVYQSYDKTTEDQKEEKAESVSFGEEPEVNANQEAAEPGVSVECTEEACTEKACEESSEQEDNQELNIVLDGLCANINVRRAANNKINIDYINTGTERQKEMYEFYSYKEGNTVYAGIRRVGKFVFAFNPKACPIYINVELPEKMGQALIKTASGDIEIENVNSDSLIAESASGYVKASKIYTTDFKIRSLSGNVRVNDINGIKMIASVMSGDIKADNIDAKDISIKSVSGSVEIKNLTGDIIDVSSLSGSLNMINIKASECKVRSTSGGIEVNEFEMNNADVSNASGGIKLYNIIGDGLRASSISGKLNLEVNVKRCHASSKSGSVEVKCHGDVLLESSSTSGSVDVHLKNFENGYCVKTRTTSGALYINYGDTHKRNLKTGTYTYGNQGSELILGSVSGDIHLND